MRQCVAACQLLAAASFVPLAAAAQSSSGNGVFIDGGAAPAPAKTCVQVDIAGQTASSLNCLNQALSQAVQGSARTMPTPPLGAGSPSNGVGTFNEQGVRQQYGQNFGKSVIPYRPPPLVYNNSLH